MFNIASGRRLATISALGRFADRPVAAASQDGSTFAVSSDAGVVRAYAAATGAPVGATLDLPPPAGRVLSMTLTGHGQVLLALDNGELSAWQVPTGTLLAQQAAAAVDSADDGGLLATVTGSSRLRSSARPAARPICCCPTRAASCPAA